MQAIQTKVIPATDTKPTRIKASCGRGSRIFSADSYAGEDMTNSEATHRRVALALINRFLDEDAKQYGSNRQTNPWAGHFATGCLPDGSFAHVFTNF